METEIIPKYVKDLINELAETKSMLRTAEISSELWHKKYSDLLDDYTNHLVKENNTHCEYDCKCVNHIQSQKDYIKNHCKSRKCIEV